MATTSAQQENGRTDPELIEEALELEEIDHNLYRSVRLWKPLTGRGAFGGQVIAQATWAATKTVDPKYHLHSLHAYFIYFGDANARIIYQVERLRDGKSYCTRSVTAIQHGRVIFTITCSFQVPEPLQPKHQYAMPRLPGTNEPFPSPEQCKSDEARAKAFLENNPNLSEKIRTWVERGVEERKLSSIEIRKAGPKGTDSYLDDQSGTVRANWFRSRAKVKNDPAFQKCVLAYASDFSFIGTAAQALGLGTRSKNSRIGMLASLDHSMYFYDDNVDASNWLLYYMECPVAADGRGVVQGRIYTSEGKLAVVCTQEGVVRAQFPQEQTSGSKAKL